MGATDDQTTHQDDRIRVRQGEIAVGRPLLWDVYDDRGQLLLSRGYVLVNERQRQRLLREGLRSTAWPSGEKTGAEATRLLEASGNPFLTIDQLTLRLEGILDAIRQQSTTIAPQQRIRKLGRAIQALCDYDADASLGAAHLKHDTSYPFRHSIHTALLCELVARRLNWPPLTRLSVICAALSCNVAMTELQAELIDHAGPLSDMQWDAIQAHPLQGHDMLLSAGVSDPLWLQIVIQHHERLNGRGYPAGSRGDAILPEARLLGLADRYHAMVTGRSYRAGMLVKNALRRIFLDLGQEVGSRLAQMFIKELGIYPPGSIVRLANGEKAVVIRRKGELAGPMLACIANAKSQHYARPLHRDSSEQEQFSIRDVHPSPGALPFSLSQLWDY